MVEDIVDASELHARRFNAKGSVNATERNIIFPVADGTVKIQGVNSV